MVAQMVFPDIVVDKARHGHLRNFLISQISGARKGEPTRARKCIECAVLHTQLLKSLYAV